MFPDDGVTTAYDGLWMGVSAVTLARDTHVSRTGLALLSQVGLAELAARTPDEYVEAAVRMGSDLPKLADLRAGLRARVAGSPLCDARRLASELENAYRHMWADWCAESRDRTGTGAVPN